MKRDPINNRTCSINHACGCAMIQVYTEDTFEAALKEDFTDAQRVSIYVPYLTPYGAGRFEHPIADCVADGGVVDVFLQTPKNWDSRDSEALKPNVQAEFVLFQACMDLLTKSGAHVNLRYNIHEKAVVINDNILYTGSLNALSFTGETREVMFRFDKPWIVELIVKLLGLNDCDECSSHFGYSTLLNNPDNTILFPDGGTKSSAYTRLIGNMMHRRRKELGIQIQELAQITGLSRETVANAETGVNVLRETAEKMCEALGMPMHAVPAYLVPLILQYFCRRKCSDNKALREYDLDPIPRVSVKEAIKSKQIELNLSHKQFVERVELNYNERFLGAHLNRTQELCRAVNLVFMPVLALVEGVAEYLKSEAEKVASRTKVEKKCRLVDIKPSTINVD